ncbi:putative bifunctional diguanylate cyclase/phosphodiesterase [Sphingobium subterraneum]|uniref:Diguanylate cyclase (GGDEF)-like protein n=1 Tax=Sphingobium subterraneum TaxID=627688 RepID=A0A841IX61_9SPHN|nr:bifunctional diguanylate cyclase/phosphodiesterase [Sphingobium subterraneum]MBB6123217.1 diguanylate cyclase (GGDEF)-like protein [Sphingobium subterraneum]
MSPRPWIADNDCSDDTVVPLPAKTAVGAPNWLAAIPYPAALIRLAGSDPQIDHCTENFLRTFPNLRNGFASADDPMAGEIRRAVTGFVIGKQAICHFEILRETPIGAETFACTLGWIRDLGGSGDHILLSALDRTSDRRIEESLRRELVSDTLTSLPNRIGFGEALEHMISSAKDTPSSEISVIMVDLVRFSRINESLGSLAGDELILSVAKRLKALITPDLILARLGGDEFAICRLLPNGLTDAMSLAAQIKAAVVAPVRLANFQLSIDCAVGCAIARVDEAEADELIRQAQTAVRTAKRTDRLEVYRPGVLSAARRRFLIESRLRNALSTGGLHLMFQPLVDLASNEITGFEALARWHDDELGPVSPNDFIPVAEESGLIVQLGRWALNESMRQLSRWDKAQGSIVPLRMNVNLSPIQMVRDDVISAISDALRMNGVDGRRLTIEMTESALVGDPDACRTLLNALKGFNVSIAMDDFGTGYSNMASLQSLPLDALKIDRSFVSDMLVDSDKHAIIRAILSLAQALKLKTTAEGIESHAVAEALRDMGCTVGQGFYYARPMTADDAFAYWLSRWEFEAI